MNTLDLIDKFNKLLTSTESVPIMRLRLYPTIRSLLSNNKITPEIAFYIGINSRNIREPSQFHSAYFTLDDGKVVGMEHGQVEEYCNHIMSKYDLIDKFHEMYDDVSVDSFTEDLNN